MQGGASTVANMLPVGRLMPGRDQAPSLPSLLILIGAFVLYAPLVVGFGNSLWVDDDSHSGILLLCVLGAYWHDRQAFAWRASPVEFFSGIAIVVIGFAVYFIGRITDLIQLLGLSLPVLTTGVCLMSGGVKLLRRWWLLNLLLLFTVPWLGSFADLLLVPLRLHITSAAVTLLYDLGFNVSSTGVLVNVGFVQLNVAGACVGLRSTVSILALGLLSLHFFPSRSWLAALIFLISLPIIGLGVNFLRVCSLILTAAVAGAGAVAVVHDIAAYAEIAVSIGLFLILGMMLSDNGNLTS